MNGQVIRLTASRSLGEPRRMLHRLRSAASMLTAIESGELLSALPECPLAREDHLAALNLLSLVESELVSLCKDIEHGHVHL